jgi:hypothetical protein
MKRLSTVLSEKTQTGAGSFTKVSGEEAAKIIISSAYDETLSFDERQAKLLGLSQGATVSVAPDDSGTPVSLLFLSSRTE